jgi:hypothetical protein
VDNVIARFAKAWETMLAGLRLKRKTKLLACFTPPA